MEQSAFIFDVDMEEDQPMLIEPNKLALEDVYTFTKNTLQPFAERGDLPMRAPSPELVGRLGTPMPQSQPPSLVSSFNSISSSGSLDERFGGAASAHSEDGGVAELTTTMSRLLNQALESAPVYIPAHDMTEYAAIDVEYVDIDNYDIDAIIGDVLSFIPTNDDLTVLNAPWLDFCVDLPEVGGEYGLAEASAAFDDGTSAGTGLGLSLYGV